MFTGRLYHLASSQRYTYVSFPSLGRSLHSSSFLAKARTSSDEKINLNCWVMGASPPSKRSFPLRIAKSATVAALRKAIQSREEFAGQSARGFDIYKVSIAINDMDADLEDVQSGEDLGPESEKLKPRQVLSRVFSDPPAVSALNIIMSTPNSELLRFLPSPLLNDFTRRPLKHLQQVYLDLNSWRIPKLYSHR